MSASSKMDRYYNKKKRSDDRGKQPREKRYGSSQNKVPVFIVHP